MFNMITNIFGNIFTRHSSSFLSSLMIFKYIWTWVRNIFSMLVNLIVSLMWVIIRWILGVIEAFEYIVNSMLGIQNADGTIATPSDYINYAYMNVEGGVDFVNGLVKVFKAMVAVAIVFLIIFTIIAIIRQEYANAQAGFEKKNKEGKSGVGNDKTGIVAKLFKNLIYIIVLPLSMLFVIVGVNAVLNAFANALGAAKGTVAGQVLASSTYDANRYRKYANANKRSPIIISAYDSSDYAPDRAESFALRITSVSVQDKLKRTAEKITKGDFLSFSQSLSYQNNKISNSADYGSYYEQFVCTAEQYQVMADFIDAAELMNLEYTIKSVDDPEVSWKYVDDVVYKQADSSLTINYRDASDLNDNGKTNDVYTMVYAPANEITSPLQDALNSIMAMLGAGEYSDNVYNMMERDDSGNFVNLVQWANEKAMIVLSNQYNPKKHYSQWTKEDQVIIYELNHFSSNNTFGDATISDLKEGIELDVKQIVYRTYYPEADAYSPDKTIDCVHINGSYYPVKVSQTYADKFGNPYYELDVPDDVDFLESGYSLLKKNPSMSATLKLSSGFNINDINTWTTGDQIIVYEYYKDLSYNNSLSKFKFSEFYPNSLGGGGVVLTNSTYSITPIEDPLGGTAPQVGTAGNYVLLNGTYYLLNNSTRTFEGSGDKPGKFMGTLDEMSKIHYDFKINVNPADSTNPNYPYYEFVGANSLVTANFTGGSTTTIHQSGVALKFSKNFKYKDITTWTYKDYFIFYLYVKYNVASSLDEILYRGVVGNIYKVSDFSFYFVPIGNTTISISMNTLNSISDLNIQRSLNLDEILENNEVDTPTDKLFVSFDENSSIHLKDAESRQFTLSKNYDYYDVSTWTVADLLLTYLSSKEVICDMDTLKIFGYYAMKFETKDDGVVYRFGAKGGASTVYLSEKNVKALVGANGRKIFTSFNSFLTYNAYKFMTQLLGFSDNELISTKEDLVNNIFSSYDSYILNTAVLASNLIDAKFGRLNNVITEYSYLNSSFASDDFSTWTNMDIALYCLTGSATGSYKSYVVRGPSGEFESDGTTPILHDYFIVKDKAINISTGAFKCAPSVKDVKNNTADLKITSVTLSLADSAASISNKTQLSEYIKTRSYIKTAPGVINLSSALRYKYEATKTIDKNSISGSLSDATILDLIIAEAMGKVEDGKSYYFNIYTDGIFSYIKVGGYYVEVYDNTVVDDVNKFVKYKQARMYLTSSNDASSDIVQSYETYAYQIGNAAVEEFSYLDTIIYSITNSLEVKNYEIYKINGIPYININGMLIQTEHTFTTDDDPPVTKTVKFTDKIDIASTYLDLSYEVPGTDPPETACDHVGYLYDNYYGKYLSAGIASYDYIYERVKYTNNFDVKNITTWSPLGLLLYRLGVTSFTGGKIYQKGTDYYLYFTFNMEGVLNAYYIDVTDMIDPSKLIKIEEGDTAENNLNATGVESPTAVKIMKLRAFFSTNIYGISGLSVKGREVDSSFKKIYNYKVEGAVVAHYLNYEEILVLYQTLKSEFDKIVEDDPANTLTDYKGKIKPLESLKSTYDSTINLNNPTTWTWFDIINYDFTGKANAGAHDYYVYVSNNELYVEFSSDIYGKLYAISNSGINLFDKFEQDGTPETMSYSTANGDNNSILELIYYKVTNKTSGSITKYKYSVVTGDTAEPFYLIEDPRTGECYGIYKLPTTTSDINFSASSTNIKFVVQDEDKFHTWNVFDFIVLYAKAHTENDVFYSDIYTYNGKSYFLVADNYIDIKSLGYGDSSLVDTGKDFISVSSGNIMTSKYNLGAILGITGQKYDASATTFVADNKQICISYDKLGDSLKTAITDFYTGDYTIKAADTPDAAMYTRLFDNKNSTYISFSQDFDASDYSTWTLSDILIYYAVYNNFYTDNEFSFKGTFKVKDGAGSIDYIPEQMQYKSRVFQSYVANGYAPVFIYNIVNEDSKGSSNVYKSINLSNDAKNPKQIYFNYDVFEALKVRKPAEIYTTDTGFLGLSIYEPDDTPPNNDQINNFTYASNDITNIVDFLYKNYYFYNLNNDKFMLYGLSNGITPGVKEAIAAGYAPVSGSVNLALVDENGTNINPNEVKTWNLLHLIAIYEFSRPIKNNVFRNSTFKDLFADNYFLLYSINDDLKEKILFINGNYYNLTNYLTKAKSEDSDIEYRLKSALYNDTGTNNIVLDKVDDKVDLTDSVITYLLNKYIKNWYKDDRLIKDAVAAVADNPTLENKGIKAKEVLSKITGSSAYFVDYQEIFSEKELETIAENIKYIEENSTGSRITNIYDYVRNQLPQKIYQYAYKNITEYINDTIDETTFDYKFAAIRDFTIIEKISATLLDASAYVKEETAGSGTYVPIEISEIDSGAVKIDIALIRTFDKYKELVILLRNDVVKDEKSGDYTVEDVRAKLQNALTRAFIIAKYGTNPPYVPKNIKDFVMVESISATPPEGVVEVTYEAVANALARDKYLTIYEKIYLLGYDAYLEHDEDATNDDGFKNITNVPSILLKVDAQGKFIKDDATGIYDKNTNALTEGVIKVYVNTADNILKNLLEYKISIIDPTTKKCELLENQLALIDSERTVDQELALQRMHFIQKPSKMGAYDYSFLKLEDEDHDEHGCTSKEEHEIGVISKGSVNDYTFRTNYEDITFVKKYTFLNSVVLGTGAETCSYDYENDGSRIYRAVDANVKDAVKINLDDPTKFGMYEINPMVKTVSWPQKLMEDMQVLYPDLNWATLVATDGWLDTLGEFTSAYANGQFISKGNSSNTTAAGLVLSEFFLSKATVPVDGFANYEYDTLFDEDVIKSLMLSLMGEQAYADLSMQAEIFMEMFNSTFASILDDIARENSYEIVEGQVSNFSMCVYKSYLATVLLSSDIGEYLYTIATRIFAQYTIYETLACSTGDYAGYYAYTSGQLDETGKVIDKFVYGSFYDLVKYENMYGGNSTPVFTFSMKKAFKQYARENKIYPDSELTDSKLNEKYAERIATESSYRTLYTILFKYVDDKYNMYYSAGERIPDTSDIYCFMFETYWAMQKNLVYYTGGKKEPAYLKLYRQYLTGEISRWASAKGVSVNATDKYISKYDQYEKMLSPLRIQVIMNSFRTHMPVGYNTKRDNELAEKAEEGTTPIKDFIDILTGKVEEVEVYTTENVLERSLSYEYLKKLKKIDLWKIYDLTESSQNGGTSGNEAWLDINDLYTDIGLLISEVGEIKKLSVGDASSSNKTPNGSIRVVEEDEVYDSMVEQLSTLHQSLSNYISTQTICDKIVKASITYTLGQYGQHYVTTGYEFNIESRNYTFNANLSASRLAEYVYGGKFLIDVNALPVYTNANYNGLIRQSKEFDVKDKILKTRLEMWPELRQFASNLANYTAKVYYQTNLKDLSENIIDNVKLTDRVNVEGTPATLEYAILKYMIDGHSNCELDDETLVRIMFADTSESLANISASVASAYSEITNYLEGVTTALPGNVKEKLFSYIELVYGDSYSAAGKYNSGSDSKEERLHKLFKNVMTYLLVAEDKGSDEENPLNLDDITFKEFKLIVMDRIVDYEQNLTETAAQNANRYLTLFDLLSGQMNYTYKTREGATTTSRVLTHYLDKTGPLKIKYADDNISDVDVFYSSDRSTRNVILTLAGIANRPISEIVNLEYDSLYDRNGNYDEALGDIFVVCFYDQRDGKYYPYLGKGTNVTLREDSKSYDYEAVFGDIMIDTKYYNAAGSNITKTVGDAYPIIAKGMITPNLSPTAIRLVEGKVVFYRTQVLASTGVDANAVKATQTTSEVNTVGFTQTVETTSHKKVSGKASRAMFISSFDLKSFVNTDMNISFLQNEVAYTTNPDEFGMFSVLDEFSRYYNLFGMPLGLLFMAFMSVIPILFKATAAVLRRILDLIFYILIGPVVISMTSLDYEDNGVGKMAFDKWKQGVTQALIAALGFIIGFRLYYLLTTTTLNMSFVSEATFANIKRIGGLKFVTIDFLDVVIRFMFLLTSSSMIEKAGNMLLRIASGGEVANAFASPIGGKDVLETLQEMKDEIQKTVEKVGGIYTGKAFVDAKNAALEAAKSMIPGSAVVGSAVNMAKGIQTNRQSKKLEKDLQDKGIAKDVAKQASKSFKENKNKQQEIKEKTRLDSANNFMQTYMGSSRKDTFKKTPSPLKDLSKGFKQLGEMPDKKEKPKKPKKDKPEKKKKEKKEKKDK